MKKLLFLVPLVTTMFVSCSNNKQYTVYFDSDGGSFIPSIRVNQGETINPPSSPTKNLNKFVYWSYDSKEYDFSQPVVNDITLVAVWEQYLPAKTHKFLFMSDYCSLNNEMLYEEGQEVNLTLHVKDESKDTYKVPDDIEVLIDDKLGVKGMDYTYSPSGDYEASLKIKVLKDIFIRVMYQDSPNVFRVNEEQYKAAIEMKNLDYVQREYQYYRYSSSSLNGIISRVFISPSVFHHSFANFFSTRYSGNLTCSEYYVEKTNDNKYYQYDYDEETDKFNKSETEESAFIKSDKLTINNILDLSKITYNDIKNHFDEACSSYCFDHTVDSNTYKVTLTFMNNQLIYFSCELNGQSGELRYVNYTYMPIEIDLPIVSI